MASLNKVELIGYLGKDPESRYLPDGTVTAQFSVATTEAWKDKAGEKQERTEWHRIIAFSKLAEIILEYLAKGRQVFIEGRIQTRKWEKDGQTHYATEIVARKMLMLGSNSGSGKSPNGNGNPVPPPGDGGQNDDIPF